MPLVAGFLLALFFLTESAIAAESWQEPADFRGLKWGASIEEMQQLFPAAPNYAQSAQGDRIKNFILPSQYIGQVKTTLTLGFLDDKFASVDIHFHSAEFPILREAFVTRYGQPHRKEDIPVKTAVGAQYLNERLWWTGPTLMITIQKYGGKVTEGHARITTFKYAGEIVRQYQKQGKDAAKGL